MKLSWIGITALTAGFCTAHDLETVVRDCDLVMARQEYGETQIDKSVMGKSLTIGGRVYQRGIGTHAISMIPVSVPHENVTLRGACGIDDEVTGTGSVRFRIMSGSQILWESPVMKRGMEAATFAVKIPAGTGKLYLFTDDVDGNDYDHADWVDLKWDYHQSVEPQPFPTTLNVADFGMKPGVREDQSVALRKALTALRNKPDHVRCTLSIPKGVYHFDVNSALPMSFYLSNHDQPSIHPVGVPLVDLRDVTIEGNGSLFVFHGVMMPMLVMDSSNVSINNLSIDFEHPNLKEVDIVSVKNASTEVQVDTKRFPYQVKNGQVIFSGDGWEAGFWGAMAFDKSTGQIIENTSDIGYTGKIAEDLGNGRILFKGWNLASKGLEEGDRLVLRTLGRPHPGCVIYRSTNTTLDQVNIHHCFGMGVLGQRSENITIRGGGVSIRPGSGLVATSGADATHFSNCRGLIRTEGALYEGMMDDAINVHSTCLRIEEIIDDRTIRCRYMHGQSVGFEVFLPGEMLRFIAGPTLENGTTVRVGHVRKVSATELVITLDSSLPPEIKTGDAVENADYYPAIVFRGNTVRNNRARGTLFTTPRKIVIENNNFDHSSGSAILLAGDAQGWFESGACEDVTIRNNRFTNNLTSRYQFTEAIISIYPEVRQLRDQKAYYHRNVLIENNEFNTFDVPLLFAISTQNLLFKNNKVTYNQDFKGWGRKPFSFKRCSSIRIVGNAVEPKRNWTLQDCQLDMTPDSEIRFQ